MRYFRTIFECSYNTRQMFYGIFTTRNVVIYDENFKGKNLIAW